MKQQTRLLCLKRNLGKHFAMLLTLMLVAAFSYGQITYTWKTSPVDNSWTNASNWTPSSGSSTPGTAASDIVVITSGTPTISSGTFTIAKITVGNTASTQGTLNITGGTLNVSGSASPVTISGGVINNSAGTLSITASGTTNGITFGNPTSATAANTAGTGYFGAGALSISVAGASNYAVNFSNTSWTSPTVVPTMTFNNPTISLPSGSSGALINVAATSGGTTNGQISGSGVTLAAGSYYLINQLGAGSASATGVGTNLTINSGCTLSCTGSTTTASYGININNNYSGSGNLAATATLTNYGTINISGTYTMGVRMISATGNTGGVTKLDNFGTINDNITSGSGACITVNAATGVYSLVNESGATMTLVNQKASTAPITFGSPTGGSLTFTNAGTLTAIGGGAITMNSTYNAINNTGGTFAVNYSVAGSPNVTGNAIILGVPYTWTGTTSNDYTVATNWNPNRYSGNIVNSDIIKFTSSPSGTITNVPTTQTIGQLIVSGTNTSVTLQSVAGGTTLTAGSVNNTGDEISVASGCTLSLTSLTTDAFTLALANIAGVTGNIAGTFNINANANGGFTNVFNVQYGVTTVTGTVNNAGTVSNATTSTLIFSSGSTYNHTRTDNNGTFPAASYTSVNVGMSSCTTAAASISVTNFPASVGTFTLNQPSAFTTGSVTISTLSPSGSTLSVNNLTVQSGVLNFAAAITNITVGAGGINLPTGGALQPRINFSATSSQTIDCSAGDLTMAASNAYVTLVNFVANGTTYNGSLTVKNFIQTGASSLFYLNAQQSGGTCTGTLTVIGNFSKSGGGIFTQTSGSTGTLVMNGSAAQTFSCDAFGAGFPSIIEIKNTASSPNNTVTLGTALTVNGTLKLTSGVLVASATYPVTLSSSGYTGGSSSSYITGQVNYPSASTNPIVVPIGNGTTYAPITITPSAATSVTFRVLFAPSNSVGTFNSPLTSYNNNAIYTITLASGTISGAVSFPYTFSGGTVSSTSHLVVAAGSPTWSQVSASPSVGTVTSGTISDATTIPFSTTATTVAVGSVNSATNLFATLTYTWTGTTSNDFQVATNWSPSRTTQNSTDILQFTSSPSGTITNVPTQSIGQLVLSGSAAVILQSAASGAILTVGSFNNTGDEISVPSGCSLSLTSLTSDVFKLALANTSGVTAAIAGTLNVNANANGGFTNVYDAQYGVTTITGTVNNSGTFNNATTSTLVFNSGSTYNHTRTDNNGTFPAASYTSVNVGMSSCTTSNATISITNFPASIGTFTLNMPSAFTTGSVTISTLSPVGSTLSVNNLTVQSGVLNFAAAITNVNVGSGGINVSSTSPVGRINFAASGSQTITSTGDFNLSGTGYVTLTNFVASGTTYKVNLTVANFNQSGTSSFYLNAQQSGATCIDTLTVTGNFSRASGTLFSQTTGSAGSIIMNGNAAQTFSSNSFGAGIPQTIEIKNTASSPNNTVTLSSALTINGVLKLTSGVLVSSSSNTATLAGGYSGGSATSYISGQANYASSSTTPFTLPLGNNGVYAPITITPAATTATFKVQYGSATIGSVNSPLLSYANNSVYTISTTSAATTGTVSFPYSFTSGVVNSTLDLVLATAAATSFSQLSASPILSGSPTVTSGTISDNTSINFSTTAINVAVGSVNSASMVYNYATYTWTGATSTDYTVSTNWSPSRTSTSTTDVLKFTSSATVINVPTQSIAQLVLSGTASVSLKAASGGATLTVGSYNFSGDEVAVPSGCTLSLNSLTTDVFKIVLASTANVTGNIAGTLNVNANASGTFTNVYDAQNGVTTITGTVNNAGSFGTSSTSSLIFSSGSTYNHTRTDNNGTFPVASYTTVNVGMSSCTTGAANITITNFPASVGTFTLNQPSTFTSGSVSISTLSPSGSTLSVNNLTVQSGVLNFAAAITTLNVGSGGINLPTGGALTPRINFAASGSQTINCTGDLTLAASSAYVTLVNFVANGTTYNGSLTVNNFIQSGSSSQFYLNAQQSGGTCTGTLTVNGNFNRTAGIFTQTASSTGTLVMNGSAAQTFSSTSFGSGIPQTLEIKNTATSPNNTVTLGAALTVNGTLKLTSGLLVLGANNLTMASTSSLSPTTPTSASYVNTNSTGKLIWNSVPATGNTIFPIGTSTSYAPLTFTGGTAGANITAAVIGSFTNTPLVANNVVNLQWSILASASTQPSVTFQYNAVNQASGYSSTGAVLGTYTGGAYLESNTLGTVSGSNPYTATMAFTSDLPTSAASLYGIGNPSSFSQGIPGAPTSVSATAGIQSATVTFTAPSYTGTSSITSYTVTPYIGAVAQATTSGSTSPITVSGLTAGTAYTFTVQAVNGSGAGASGTSGSVTPTSPLPGTPTSVSATAGNASATISFTAPVYTGASSITSYTVTSTPGSYTATGASSPLTVTGLQAGTAYTFTVVATNGSGNSTASTATSAVTPTGTYTWTGATNSNYTVSTNWSPNRVLTSTQDVIQFNSNATVTNISGQTIARLVLSNNAQVSLQETSGTSATLTVGNSTVHVNGTDDISIPAGCMLTLAQNASGGAEIFTLQLNSGVTGATSNISGTLTIAQNTSSTYANVYNAANGVTTVYSTGVINYAGSLGSSTATSLIYKNGSTINNQRADATFSGACGTSNTDRVNVSFSGSNCGTSGTGQIPINNLPAFIGTLTVNATGATGTMNVRGVSGGSGLAQTAEITTLTVSSTGTGSFGFGSNTTAISTVNVGTGGITVSGGKLNLAYNIGQTITVSGDLSISNSSTVSLCGSGSNTTYTGSLTVNNFTQTGTSTFKLNANGGSASLQANFPTTILTVKGNFSVAAASTFFNQVSATPNSIVMNGSVAQTITASGTFTNVDGTKLQINNTASTVTLSSAMPTIGTLQLTSGQLILGSNSLTTATISGGSSSSYVDASGTGRLTLLAVPTASTIFPIGTSTSYAPVTFTGGTAGADISMGVKSTFTHTPNVANNVVNLEWAMLVGNSISTTPTVKFQYNANTDPAGGYVSTGAKLGTYEAGSYSESVSTVTIDATTPTATTATIAFTNDLPTATENYYGIGNPNSFAVSGLPTAPTIGTASISGSSVSVSFTAPADAVATGVTSYLVTSSPGGITATGTHSPISISGLGGGTSYTFTVKSVNVIGNSLSSAASNSITTPVYTYTWTGTTNSNYQTATNWSPNRTTPTTTDKLQFSSSATVINVPTQTIGRLTLSNNASVSLQETSGTSATLTVGNATTHTNGVDDISVPTGCTLTMAANASGGAEFLTLQLASGVTGVTANIAGTLTIAQNTPSTYANNYNTANGVTTISGTVNYAGGFGNISSTSLLFTTNSTFNNQRGDASFPPAFTGTYTRVNVSITGATSTGQVPVSNFPASVNTLTINDAGITGSGVLLVRSIAGGSGTSQVADITNLNVTNGIVGFGTNATAIATVTIGSGGINVSGGKLLLAYNNAQTIAVAGGINLSGTGLISMGSAGGSAFAATLTTTNFTQTGASTFYVNGYFGSAPLPTATMNVTGNFSIGSTSTFSQATGVTGLLVFNSTNAAQTISNAGTISNISTVQVNNTNGSTNNIVTLSTALTIPNALTLTSGSLAIGSNNLTVKGTFTNNTSITGSGTTILGGSSAQTISGTGTVTNFTLSNSSGATISSGSNKLNVLGVLTLQSGTLTSNSNLVLKSTSIANSGILAPVNSGGNTGSVSGTATVERFIPKGFRAYRDLSSSVYNTSNTFFNTWQESGSYTNNGYGMFITGKLDTTTKHNVVDGTTGLDHSITGSPSAFYYKAGWDTVKNTRTELLNPYQAYRVLVRGDRSFDLDTTPVIAIAGPTVLAMQNSTSLRASGSLITGDVVYSRTGVTNTVTGATYNSATYGLNPAANSYTYIANPYACPIDFKSIYTNNRLVNVQPYYYYLDPTIGSTGAWVVYNAESNASTKWGLNSNGEFIQAGQGFLIRDTSKGEPTLTITEADKSILTSAKIGVFGSTASTSGLSINLMKQSGTNYMKMDAAIAVFGSQFSNGIGREDAGKMSNATDNLSIVESGKSLSIDGRLPATTADVLPINLGQLSGTNYQLVINSSGFARNGVAPYIKDAFTNQTITLSSGIDTIAFTTDAKVAATYQNRFSVVFKPTTLAVNSIVTNATANGTVATITWNTVGEKSVAKFEVEKSTNGSDFVKIGEEAAKNTATASYTATDDNVNTTSFYRIKAVSIDGTITYSNTAKLTTNNSPLTTIYPNPLVGKKLNIDFSTVNAGKYLVTITNALGQKVAEQSLSHTGGNGNHSVNIESSIAKGVYNVVISSIESKQTVYQTKLSVQ